MTRTRTFLLVAALAPSLLFADSRPSAPPAGIPPRPEQLVFPPLSFDVPRASAYRTVLKNGMVVYLAEDDALPLVGLTVLFRGGTWMEPPGQEGVAALTASQMRRGGTARLDAQAFDERLDFLATQMGASVGPVSAGASLNCLADTLDESLRLFVEMLKTPRFQEDRLALARTQVLQDMAARNDEPGSIEGREWSALLYGPAFYTNRLSTKKSVESITREDLQAFRRRVFHPKNAVIAVSGAFFRADMLRRLEAAFAGDWGPAPTVPPVPTDMVTAEPAVYRIQKDVPQARVTIGLPSVKRTSPDIYALEVMNEILGGSGFNSRITREVRSNEGLAYQAASGISFGVWYPGMFRAVLQSKSSSATRAARMVIDLIGRLRQEPPSDAEMQLVKKSLIESFPSTFASKGQTVGIFANDEYTGRPADFWQSYRQRILAVTPADVQRVARQYLVPEKMVVLVVGNLNDVEKGEGEHAVAWTELGPKVVDIPLPDPLTLERPKPVQPVSSESMASTGAIVAVDVPCGECGGVVRCEVHAPAPARLTAYCGACRSEFLDSALLPSSYELVRELGRGGMGAVYLGRHRTLGVERAIKVILPKGALSEAMRALFLDEARVHAKLNHPRIVQVHDLAEVRPAVFAIVMEYVAGRNAGQLLRDQDGSRLSPALAVGIACQVLEALAYVHAQGVVHCDIKDPNVLVADAPEVSVKLSDFGLARAYAETGTSSPSRTQVTSGTVPYMSPEQARGERVSPLSDLYSLGATLYRLLAGAYPHDYEEGVNALEVVRERGALPLAVRNPEVPAVVAAAVDRALARDPSGRFECADDMRVALRDALATG